MKRFTQLVCIILVLSVALVTPVFAVESTTWGSDYFGSRSCYLHKVSSTSFQIWFDVTSMRTMAELGVNYIEVQRSSDNGSTWESVQTYADEDYSQMIRENTSYHGDCVTYFNAEAGYRYIAYVKFYAKNSSGTATYGSYTSSITMP